MIYKHIHSTTMNVLKTMIIDDIECVVIRLKDYNDFMFSNYAEFQKIHTNIDKMKKKEEKQEEVESRRIAQIMLKDERDRMKEDDKNKRIEMAEMRNKFNNDRLKKEKEDIATQYKEYIDTNPDAVIRKCRFCKNYRVFPLHFFDEDGNRFHKSYLKDKIYHKASCCSVCYDEMQVKKEEKKTECSMFCKICETSYIAYTDDYIRRHNNSTKHKKNKHLDDVKNKKKPLNFELFTSKELQTICSKSFTDDNTTYLIPNYTRIKKIELMKRMYDVYDKLDLSFYL